VPDLPETISSLLFVGLVAQVARYMAGDFPPHASIQFLGGGCGAKPASMLEPESRPQI